MHYGYGVEVQRATGDFDFAFELGELPAYKVLRSALMDIGYQAGEEPQRLISPTGLPIGLVPFGDIADDEGNVTLPPEHDFEMSVLGFSEALAHAQTVRIAHDPLLDVPVVSLPGLILFKLIAWGNREIDRRAKDAQDVRHVLDSYLKIPHEVTGIWEETAYLERFDGDIDQVVAAVLGRETKAIANKQSAKAIEELLTGDHLDAFILDMDARYGTSPSTSPRLVESFSLGFFET